MRCNAIFLFTLRYSFKQLAIDCQILFVGLFIRVQFNHFYREPFLYLCKVQSINHIMNLVIEFYVLGNYFHTFHSNIRLNSNSQLVLRQYIKILNSPKTKLILIVCIDKMFHITSIHLVLMNLIERFYCKLTIMYY